MKLSEYIEEVKNHRILGGNHPWYVFKGHPIPILSESKESFVPYGDCPIPPKIKEAFMRGAPIPPLVGKEREMFVNAQWALGGEGTGAPVSLCFVTDFIVFVYSFVFLRFIFITQPGQHLSMVLRNGCCFHHII
jgi:hypothetical protein